MRLGHEQHHCKVVQEICQVRLERAHPHAATCLNPPSSSHQPLVWPSRSQVLKGQTPSMPLQERDEAQSSIQPYVIPRVIP